MIGLSDGYEKVGKGDVLDHFRVMTNFLPESCQNKMTTQRLSQNRHSLSKGCQKVVIIKVVIGLS